MRNFVRATAFSLLLLAGFAMPATGEIYRCVGPDGAVSFTSRPDGCAGAKPHEPSGQVQSVPSSGASRPHPARRSSSATAPPTARTDEAQAAAWRARRRAAQKEHKQVATNVENFRRVVAGCNRGSDWWLTDENGMRRRFTCEEARAEHESLQRRLVELDDYLARGLAEECRRAGCLPGWIR